MTNQTSDTDRLRVIIVGGGVAALESALALAALAPELTDVSVLAPDEELVYRPMTVREPFGYGSARRYPLRRIVEDAGAKLLADRLEYVDPATHTVHTRAGERIEYDALVLALGAHPTARYKHALTIDDQHLDETLHGLLQDVEGGYVRRLAFVAPGRMAWPMPLYELALMTAARAFDVQVDLSITIVTPEDSPLAIFGAAASDAVTERLHRAGIETISSAYVEIQHNGELVINPGDRRLQVDRVVALPELYGPGVRGIPLAEHGFIRVDAHGSVIGVQDIYAAGDAIEFPVKQGGLGSQQADAVARSIAAKAGADVVAEPFAPVLRGILLTGERPIFLTARITGGQGFSSQITDEPTWSPPSKIAALYLAPYLERLDKEGAGGEASAPAAPGPASTAPAPAATSAPGG
jgi:sulfide:quinone oxidoreductase